MGRPPCCDKVGIKKGPWTPEEDIILVSYIQEHGPGNWRSVPTNTGLLRCSKSCRLRWTNYLRPGIKRGNFTPHEEGMIIHLQALLGNKWASIASYLPQRTDNDIKNYWNTHLKKKLKKFQSSVSEPNIMTSSESTTADHHHLISKISFNDRKSLDINAPNSSSSMRLNQMITPTYASSTENISRLLEGWMRSSPKITNITISDHPKVDDDHNMDPNQGSSHYDHMECFGPKIEQEGEELVSDQEVFDSILSFEILSNNSNTNNVHDFNEEENGGIIMERNNNYNNKVMVQKGENNGGNPPMSFLEKWLFDESSGCGGAAAHVGEMMELSSSMF